MWLNARYAEVGESHWPGQFKRAANKENGQEIEPGRSRSDEKRRDERNPSFIGSGANVASESARRGIESLLQSAPNDWIAEIRRTLGTAQLGKTSLLTADLVQVLAHLPASLAG